MEEVKKEVTTVQAEEERHNQSNQRILWLQSATIQQIQQSYELSLQEKNFIIKCKQTVQDFIDKTNKIPSIVNMSFNELVLLLFEHVNNVNQLINTQILLEKDIHEDYHFSMWEDNIYQLRYYQKQFLQLYLTEVYEKMVQSPQKSNELIKSLGELCSILKNAGYIYSKSNYLAIAHIIANDIIEIYGTIDKSRKIDIDTWNTDQVRNFVLKDNRLLKCSVGMLRDHLIQRFTIEKERLQTKYSDLEQKYKLQGNVFTGQFQKLQLEKQQLQNEFDELQQKYQIYEPKMEQMQKDYKQLKLENKQLKSVIRGFEQQIQQFQEVMNEKDQTFQQRMTQNIERIDVANKNFQRMKLQLEGKKEMNIKHQIPNQQLIKQQSIANYAEIDIDEWLLDFDKPENTNNEVQQVVTQKVQSKELNNAKNKIVQLEIKNTDLSNQVDRQSIQIFEMQKTINMLESNKTVTIQNKKKHKSQQIQQLLGEGGEQKRDMLNSYEWYLNSKNNHSEENISIHPAVNRMFASGIVNQDCETEIKKYDDEIYKIYSEMQAILGFYPMVSKFYYQRKKAEAVPGISNYRQEVQQGEMYSSQYKQEELDPKVQIGEQNFAINEHNKRYQKKFTNSQKKWPNQSN